MSTMTAASQDASVLMYFGKLPLRGDFVRSAHGSSVVNALDRWISESLERLAIEPDWRRHFDALQAVEFAFVGSRSQNLIAGHMVGSRDSSGRRYPFIVAGRMQTSDPLALLACLPVHLMPAWQLLDQLVRGAQGASSIEEALDRIEASNMPVDNDLSMSAAALASYLDSVTVGQLQTQLADGGNRLDLRQSIIALGLLLLPLLSGSAGVASKGLALPLPSDKRAASFAAAFWLSCLAPFLVRANHELALLHVSLSGRPQLLVSFNGVNAATLEAVFDPARAFETNIDLCEAEWVEDMIAGEYPLSKLSSYLEHPGLSLRQALTTFSEVFLGA